MKLPSYPQKGKPVEDTIRGLIDFARASRLTGFIGGRVVETANGTTIIADQSRPASSVGGARSHPFKIVADEVAGNPVIRVSDGAFTVQSWFTNGNLIECNAEEEAVAIGAGNIGTESGDGYLSVSPSTTYGVFILAETLMTSTTAFANGTGYPGKVRVFDPLVVIDSTNTTASSLNAMTSTGSYSGYCGWFLGTVVVDAVGGITITQYRKSDITVVEPVWVYQTIVSLDASNSISTGSDGGAFYDEP